FGAAIVACLATAPLSAKAEPVDWLSGISFSADIGPENILVIFGFNPQPEPPAMPAPLVQDDVDPTAAVRNLLGVEPTPFELFIAATGGTFGTPALPMSDFASLVIPFTTTLGNDVNFVLDFTPSVDGDNSTATTDALFFNPQPEPPALPADLFGLLFAFELGADDTQVAVSLEIQDPVTDEPFALTAVAIPAPPAVLLLGAGLLLLGARRARARA
ncbi:MAG: hypothetical protein AAFQ33_17040, partial [Pseudomonadota bacterium]